MEQSEIGGKEINKGRDSAMVLVREVSSAHL